VYWFEVTPESRIAHGSGGAPRHHQRQRAGGRPIANRRFLLEEGFERARAEVIELLERTAAQTSAGRADGQRDRRLAVLTLAAESAYRLAQNPHIVASR